MELKNYNKCLVLLSDFINAKIEYFDRPEFYNMYTDMYYKEGDEDINDILDRGRANYGGSEIYLVYRFVDNIWLSNMVKMFDFNGHYNYYTYRNINNNKYVVFAFSIYPKDETKYKSILTFDKRPDAFVSIYKLLLLWKDHLKEFYDIFYNTDKLRCNVP